MTLPRRVPIWKEEALTLEALLDLSNDTTHKFYIQDDLANRKLRALHEDRSTYTTLRLRLLLQVLLLLPQLRSMHPSTSSVYPPRPLSELHHPSLLDSISRFPQLVIPFSSNRVIQHRIFNSIGDQSRQCRTG